MMGVPVKWGATRSGRATLHQMDDRDARSLDQVTSWSRWAPAG
jgi:hypothetical protein